MSYIHQLNKLTRTVSVQETTIVTLKRQVQYLKISLQNERNYSKSLYVTLNKKQTAKKQRYKPTMTNTTAI